MEGLGPLILLISLVLGNECEPCYDAVGGYDTNEFRLAH